LTTPTPKKVRIGLGLANFPLADVRQFWDWIELCEANGIDSFWQTDRLVSQEPFLESISTMAAVAGATDRMKFGMNVTVVTFRDPLVLAKQCATIDFLSGGRLLPAFGVGPAVAPEFKTTSWTAKARGARADEALEVMVRLWTEDQVTHQGRFFSYRDACISPKPVQRPLPLWIGGSSDAAIRRTARIGTGWISGIQTPAQVAPVVERIAQEAQAAGRPIDDDHYGAGFAFRFGSWSDPVADRAASGLKRFAPDMDARDYFAVGGVAEIRQRIDEYRAAGISKFVLRPLAGDDRDFIDQTRRLIAEVVPPVHAQGA
jgi:probable F420-dependent oxidoreductase